MRLMVIIVIRSTRFGSQSRFPLSIFSDRGRTSVTKGPWCHKGKIRKHPLNLGCLATCLEWLSWFTVSLIFGSESGCYLRHSWGALQTSYVAYLECAASQLKHGVEALMPSTLIGDDARVFRENWLGLPRWSLSFAERTPRDACGQALV